MRDYIFRAARDAGDLDRTLENMYEQGDINPYWDEDFEGVLPGSELRGSVDVSDFPGAIPYQGVEVNPDYEQYNAFRLATENLKISQYLQNQPFQLDAPIEQSRQALYDAYRRGQLSAEDLTVLNEAGRSDLMASEGLNDTVSSIIGEVIRGTTGSNQPYERNIERVADALGIIDDVTDPVTLSANLLERNRNLAQINRLTSPFSERIPSRIPGLSTATQLGLPLTQIDPRIENLITGAELPERFEDFRTGVTELTRLGQQGRRSNPYEGDPETNIRRQILPQVSSLFNNDELRTAVSGERIRRREENSRNRLYSITQDLIDLRDEQDFMRRSLERRPSEINPYIENDLSGTPRIPGLALELADIKDKAIEEEKAADVRKLNEFIEKYPEVGPYFSSPLRQEQPKIERDLSKLQAYVDPTQEISKPEDRMRLYEQMGSELGVPMQAISELERDYTSGDPEKQKGVRDYIQRLGYGEGLAAISSPALSTRTPVVGGGGYKTDTEEAKKLTEYIRRRKNDFDTLARSLTPEGSELLRVKQPPSGKKSEMYSFDPETNEAYLDPEGQYGVELSRGYNRPMLSIEDPLSGLTGDVSLNALKYFAENPVTNVRSVSFQTTTPDYSDFSYEAKDIPRPVFDLIESFVKRNMLTDMQPGTIVVNSPIGTTDIARRLEDEGVGVKESSTLRREADFIGAKPNRRGAAYRAGGFGPLTKSGEQFAYVNAEGNIVPLQPSRPAPSLAGSVFAKPASVRGSLVDPSEINVSQSREPLTAKAYYSADPVAAAAIGAGELARGIRRAPASLLPGASDLIPSPEAIQTGYSQGPLAMGQQMGREFIQSLPTSAVAAGVLSTPLAAPLAPGIGAGLVGTAGARALNEVVRQETGEGIVPKLRQALGTAPRTGVSGKPRVGERPLVAEIRPLNAAQKAEVARQANRNELQRRIDLAKERFNPRRGELGLSELIFGR
jgi:hypothetical protein